MVNFFLVIIIVFIVFLALCLAAICCYLIRNGEMRRRSRCSSSAEGSVVLDQVEVVIGTMKLQSGDEESSSHSSLSSESRFTSPAPDLQRDTQNTTATVHFNEDVEVCYVFEKAGSTSSKERNGSRDHHSADSLSTPERAPL